MDYNLPIISPSQIYSFLRDMLLVYTSRQATAARKFHVN